MSIIPKGKPQLSPVLVRRLAQYYGIEIPKDGKVAVLAIRDYYLDTIGKPGKGDRNTYDDAAWIMLGDRCVPYNFSTDPSAWRRGMATLKPGLWWMIPGKHKAQSASGYEAFRQWGNFTVIRDDQGEHTGYFGINLHRGGFNGTSSEGCQTVPPLQWTDFRETIRKALGVSLLDFMKHILGIPGKQFPYILVTKAEAEKILGIKI
jgi:lysozyme